MAGCSGIRQLVLAALIVWALPAQALHIVLTNDDGFETANVQALYRALIEEGHEVILSAPYGAQSGTSGQIAFMRPIGPTRAASPAGTLPAGSPGVGATGLAPHQYYVDGSPAAALLYGLDVLAKRRWQRFPDLVLSGPNEGHNLGIVTAHSGTVGATVTALAKGIPAVAVSADSGAEDAAPVVAALAVRLVAALDGPRGVRLPPGIGLNVNIPAIPAAAAARDFRFTLTRIGTSAPFGLAFYEHLGDSSVAVGFGVPAGLPLPGVSIEAPAERAGYPVDDDPRSESNALAPDVVTVSPIEATYAADPRTQRKLRRELRDLFRASPGR